MNTRHPASTRRELTWNGNSKLFRFDGQKPSTQLVVTAVSRTNQTDGAFAIGRLRLLRKRDHFLKQATPPPKKLLKKQSLPPVGVILADDMEDVSSLEGQAQLPARHKGVIGGVVVKDLVSLAEKAALLRRSAFHHTAHQHTVHPHQLNRLSNVLSGVVFVHFLPRHTVMSLHQRLPH
ncbi:hypothetical protein EYF80_013632 [Liparis tanakae]|uniref:Uncharacterized protein n=1 Tax=Liparis tanakae TaxID=230148 RepID=A0A4Z2IEA9_9TELE|nr:hypothetical protein EYF80_013632 [Liparis tanakae]